MPLPLHIVTVVDRYPCLSETFIEREVQELRRQGAEVEVVALRGDGPHTLPSLPARFLQRKILRRHFRHPRYCISLLRRAGQAAALAERLHGRPDSRILAQFAWTTADVARMAAGLCGVPWIVRAHARDVFVQSGTSLLRRLESAAAVLPCNEAAADAVRACGFPADRIAVIHHGLPLDLPEWGWQAPSNTIRLIGIGRLIPKKGVHLLLEACAVLRQGNVHFELEWVGEGPERERLQQLAAKLGLEDRVHFSGGLSPEETRRRLRSAAMLVLPSLRLPDGDRDGIANVLVEAMALGVPVVTTTAGGAPEIIVHGVNGLLVPPDDSTALAAILASGLDQDEAAVSQRLALSKAARTTVERYFDLARNTSLLLREARQDDGEERSILTRERTP